MPPDVSATASSSPAPRSWLATLKVYTEPVVLRMLLLGFSAGLPLLLVLGTLGFWLREAGIDRKTIGYLSWVGLAYGLKWAWAPLVDRLPLPFITRWLGQRRSWLLLAQLAIMGGLIGMAMSDPTVALRPIVICALIVAFASATQDIALDAFRIESAEAEKQAALAAAYQTGYRLAMIWAGAGVLWIAAGITEGAKGYLYAGWQGAYVLMAASMLVGVIITLASREPAPRDLEAERAERQTVAHTFSTQGIVFSWPLLLAMIGVGGLLVTMARVTLGSATMAEFLVFAGCAAVGFVGLDRRWGTDAPLRVPAPGAITPLLAHMNLSAYRPFADFIVRNGRHALLILALIAIYRISDVVMGIMANPFYVDMGYTKEEVAAVSKVYGLIMTLVGGFVGGALALRFGVLRVLFLGAVLSALTNLLFSWLATRGHDVTALIWVISADNLASGMAGAAFIAYLSSLTNLQYSATQYALFSSIMLLLPKYVAGFSGAFVDAYGYVNFFNSTAALGVPVLILILLAMRYHPNKAADPRTDTPKET
ncbi:permease [beta proteobacterium AAP99]|nr:permease [beta proteobacterium AAP99]